MRICSNGHEAHSPILCRQVHVNAWRKREQKTLYDHIMRPVSEKWESISIEIRRAAGKADEVEAVLMAVRDQNSERGTDKTDRRSNKNKKTFLLSPVFFFAGRKKYSKYLKPHKSVNTGYNMPIRW